MDWTGTTYILILPSVSQQTVLLRHGTDNWEVNLDFGMGLMLTVGCDGMDHLNQGVSISFLTRI